MDSLGNVASWLMPLVAIGLVILVQVCFWIPIGPAAGPQTMEEQDNKNDDDQKSTPPSQNAGTTEATSRSPSTRDNQKERDDDGNDDEDLFKTNDSNWRCACEGGFLPPGMLKSFGGAEAMMRLGTGQCYHKQM